MDNIAAQTEGDLACPSEPDPAAKVSLKIVLPVVLFSADAALMFLALLISIKTNLYQILPYALPGPWLHAFSPWLCLLVWFVCQGHYKNRSSLSTEVAQLIVGTGLAAVVLAFSPALWLISLSILVSGRVMTKWILFKLGYWNLPTVVIGLASQCAALHQLLDHDWYKGFWITHEIPHDGANVAALAAELSRLGRGGEIRHFLLAINLPAPEMAVLQAIGRNYGMTFGVAVLPAAPFNQLVVDRYFGNDLVVVREVSMWWPQLQVYIKRALDVILSSLLLMVLAPLFILIGCVIRRDGGSVFYGSARIGAQGRSFRALKFRTMVVNADQVLHDMLVQDPEARHEWEATFKLRNDPRITRIGGFLRRLSFDELPQLINVLRGEMSLVGPRPLLPAEREGYGAGFDLYCKCLPGITGPWQVSGRNDLAYYRRMELNSWYAKNFSVWIDMIILARTVLVVFRRVGAV